MFLEKVWSVWSSCIEGFWLPGLYVFESVFFYDVVGCEFVESGVDLCGGDSRVEVVEFVQTHDSFRMREEISKK